MICQDQKSPDRQLACDAMVLGTLLKGCVKAGIWPAPEYPYRGFAIRQALTEIKAFKIHSLCEVNKEGVYDMYRNRPHLGGKASHDLAKQFLESVTKDVQGRVQGLKLRDFE